MSRQQQQHEQQLQQQQQQQYTMQQQMLQQSMMQRHKYGMAPVGMFQDLPLQLAVPSVAIAVEPAPYGRALSTLRHKHDAAIICFFKSQGPSDGGKAPTAASVAAAFKQLCSMRASKSLPPDAAWFKQEVTGFTDMHETPFKNYVRRLFARY
eukprot:5839-Heterococcus_DN1.PRE.1